MLKRSTPALLAALAIVALSGVFVSSALALGTPGWQIVTFANPTAFSLSEAAYQERSNQYVLIVSNVGGVPTNGSRITLTDKLPPGVAIRGISSRQEIGTEGEPELPGWYCPYPGGWEPGGDVVTCTSSASEVVGPMGQLPPLVLRVEFGSIVPGSEVTNRVTVSGGGAPVASATQVTEVEPSVPLSFGVTDLTSFLTDLNGEPDTQAGDHPNGLTTSFDVNNTFDALNNNNVSKDVEAVQRWKDVVIDLPPGVVGNPQVAAQCLLSKIVGGCPAASQVGTLGFSIFEQYGSGELGSDRLPVYNMVPESDAPAEFAFSYLEFPIGIYPTVVGEGATAHIRVTTPGIPDSVYINPTSIYTKFFGDPAAADGSPQSPNAFFTNSTDCEGGPLVTGLHVDSYEDPGSYGSEGSTDFNAGPPDFSDPAWKSKSYSSPPVTGCEKLHFDPSMAVQPETTEADEPSGMAVELKVPQNPDPHGLETPPFKSVTVTLPSGVSLSPGSGDGLQACSEAQFEPLSNKESSCPNASVLGTVTASTPLLAAPLTGYVFLGQPECDPCTDQDATDGKMFRLLIQVEGSGVVQKVQGTVDANTTTGQLTASFPENPQFPVSDLQLVFKGGLRAGLATPQSCGKFTATSDMVPWSTPYTPDATPSASLNISWNGQGEACPAISPLTPSFSAGTSNANAGQFSPFTLTFAREDRQQDLSQISVSTPPGLLGTLTGVPLCGEPQAQEGTCSEASRIGKMTVAAGPGGHPFYTQGKIYLTGPYKGAPFGLSIVVPTQAGPFNLGNVVVRSQVTVNPETAALTVTSDPFPQILDGIPLRLRTANVTIDRPDFIFNPTNCAPLRIDATIVGVQGASANVSSPFAVAGCAGLHFGPTFTVSTTAHTSRAAGASLDAKLVFPTSDGAQSDIAHVKVELPKRLPSRLTTLQKACPEATFNADPASCPAASAIGIAKTITPVLPVPLEGPVYFVSRGGAAFPDLVVVLQGYGVRVDLTATTFISKAGVTSTTFDSIPDVPVNSFELYLPQGPYSALAANGNLCTGGSLAMPTQFIAQDGARLQQDTKIAVTGCPKAKKATTKKATRKKAKKSSGARKSSHGGGRRG